MMMSEKNDFKITFQEEDDSVVFESTTNSTFVRGASLVSQKVLHSLFSIEGQVVHDPTWGSGLLRIFDSGMNLNKKEDRNFFVTACLKKTLSDIKRTQPENLPLYSKLKNLSLISIKERVTDSSLEVKIRVIVESGESELLVI